MRSHSPVFSTYNDLGYVQVLCLVTQHWHIKRRQTRQIRRGERLSDSWLPGWVTLLRDPLRGAQPWVTSVPQSGRKTSNTRPVQPPPLCSSLSCCSPELHGGSLKTVPAVTTPWISPVYPLAATTPSYCHSFFTNLYLLSASQMNEGGGMQAKCIYMHSHHLSSLWLIEPLLPQHNSKICIPGTRSDAQLILAELSNVMFL